MSMAGMTKTTTRKKLKPLPRTKITENREVIYNQMLPSYEEEGGNLKAASVYTLPRRLKST